MEKGSPLKLRNFYSSKEQAAALKDLTKKYRKIYGIRRSMSDFIREGIELVLEKYRTN